MVAEVVTVRIFLMGLVALAPANGDRQLTVVLPNAADHDHTAVFVWNPANYDGDKGHGAAIQKRLELRETPYGYLMNGYTIEMEPPGSEPLEFLGGLQGGHSHRRLTAAIPNEGNAKHFSWVPSMERLTDGLGHMDRAYFSGADPRLVAARMKLAYGTAQTYSFADTFRMVRAVRFIGMGKLPMLAARQAVADVILIEVEVPRAAVIFHVRKLDAKPEDDDVYKVRLEPEENVATIDVLVGNVTRPPTTCHPGMPDPALHFAHYNSMLALRSEYHDRLLPRVGEAIMPSDGVDPAALPLVLSVVSVGACEDQTPDFEYRSSILGSTSRARAQWKATYLRRGGIVRPICMVARFQAPE